MYYRHRPTPVVLLSDPDCRTHRAFGVPRIEFLPKAAASGPNGPRAQRWRNSRRRASTLQESSRNRYSRWRATPHSTRRTASNLTRPIVRSSRTTAPSSSGTSSSMRLASSGRKSRHATGRAAFAGSRSQRRSSPPLPTRRTAWCRGASSRAACIGGASSRPHTRPGLHQGAHHKVGAQGHSQRAALLQRGEHLARRHKQAHAWNKVVSNQDQHLAGNLQIDTHVGSRNASGDGGE